MEFKFQEKLVQIFKFNLKNKYFQLWIQIVEKSEKSKLKYWEKLRFKKNGKVLEKFIQILKNKNIAS